jgi:serine/threonine protein kinase/tetratricopeptide (TPR) repeat protein
MFGPGTRVGAMSSELLRAQLQDTLGEGYHLERELGGGGMSRVFLATETALGRRVVVKMLPPDVAAAVSVERFRREIQLAARLNHPHIVPLLSAGESGGFLYYTMPFVEGESLRVLLRRDGALPIDQAVRIVRDVADALAYAHECGVAHRDVKPDNVLLSRGHALVADFGVAKALSAAATSPASVTATSVTVGTPLYMAPEQIAADPQTDHRADIYALGVVAYELLAGRPPFGGESPQALFAAHMTRTPEPVGQHRQGVPLTLERLVMRCLEKGPADRPQSAAEMIGILDAVATPTGLIEADSRGKRRGRHALWAAIPAVVIAGAVGAWQLTRPPLVASAQSLAIAPFSVPTGDTALVRLGQNLVTTLSANLDGVGEIWVADPISVLSHARGKGSLLSLSDVMAIARKLGAKSVVHGSLVPTGRTVRADAALYELSDARRPIVRVSVVAPADSLTAMTDSLTWGLLRAVWNRGRAPTPHYTSITTHSSAALREFLDGERLFARAAFNEASEAYKRAIAADTTFWFAYYRYRSARGWLSQQPADTPLMNRLRRHMHELPDRERQFVTLADSDMSQGDRIRELNRILARHPDFTAAWISLADFLIHNAVRSGHDVSEAIEPWRKVMSLTPSDMEAANHLAFACVAAGDLTCARPAYARFDSLVRLDSSPRPFARLNHRSLALVLDGSRNRVDSLIQVGRQDSIFPAAFVFDRMRFMPATVSRPDLVADWDRVAEAIAKSARSSIDRRETAAYVTLLGRAMRGDWSEVDSMVALRRDFANLLRWDPGWVPSSGYAVQMRVLGELQGFIPPDRRTAQVAMEIASAPGATEDERIEGRWIAGLNALLRGDSSAYREHLVALTGEADASAGIGVRSLRAIREGQFGRRAVAAESLLVLEREHADASSELWPAFAADRLLAAQWLTDERRYAPADSLLRFTRGYIIWGTAEAAALIFASAQLQRSRIAEGLGRRQDAVAFATIFLNSFDLAPPSQKALIDEAKSRIARLSRQEVAPRKARVQRGETSAWSVDVADASVGPLRYDELREAGQESTRRATTLIPRAPEREGGAALLRGTHRGVAGVLPFWRA